MRITDKINIRHPKYMLPAILYIPLLACSYFVIDLFHAEKAETQDKAMQTTEYLNPELPGAKIRGGDGIGSKYENMAKSWGKITDETAVDNIDRDDPQETQETYESKYTQEDMEQIALLDKEKDDALKAANAKTREQEAIEELNRALAEARLKAQAKTESAAGTDSIDKSQPAIKGKIEVNEKLVSQPTDTEQPAEVVKKVRVTSDYFNTLAQNEADPKLIKAIIDEDIKAVDGSRVRLRLLDDVEIGETTMRRGSYLYATMSGFSSQRVKGAIQSIMVGDEIIKVSLSLYDTDGMEGLYVPQSQFRETTKDVASGAMSGNMNMGTGNYNNSFAQWGMQAVTNAYQKTSNAISKAIKKNKVKLKYGTFVYLVNGKEKKQ